MWVKYSVMNNEEKDQLLNDAYNAIQNNCVDLKRILDELMSKKGLAETTLKAMRMAVELAFDSTFEDITEEINRL